MKIFHEIMYYHFFIAMFYTELNISVHEFCFCSFGKPNVGGYTIFIYLILKLKWAHICCEINMSILRTLPYFQDLLFFLQIIDKMKTIMLCLMMDNSSNIQQK